MNRYWTRIAIGAIAIFAVGLMGIAGIRKGKAKVSQILASVGTRIPMRLAHLDVSVDGRRLGALKSLKVQRASAGELGSVAMTVALEEAGDLAGLRDCVLAAERLDELDEAGFRCADASELSELVEIGEVTFEPGATTKPFYLSSGMAEKWREAGVRSLEANLVTDAEGGVTADGRFDLMDRRHGAKRGTFHLRATEAGAEITVKDHRGRSLFDFRASENGVRLNIQDGQARELVKLLTDRR